MIGKKKLGEIKAEVAALLGRLPGRSPRRWLEREIKSSKEDRKRDVETLEMLCAALERDASKPRTPKSRRKPAPR
jgi:hypothetical protein